MMKKLSIGILPIDNRPCNYDYVQNALDMKENIKLIMCPESYLGEFKAPGNIDAMQNFILENAKEMDYLIVSTDALCFGGLIQARKANKSASLKQYVNRFNVLEKAKIINPNLKIYAYSVIMRLTISVSNESNVEQWQKIFEYSRLRYLAELDSGYNEKLDKLVETIDSNLLETYNLARKRNHAINMEALKFVKNGAIDYLSLIQEDSQTEGIQLLEQKRLKEQILESKIDDKVSIKNGTDEMVCLLTARVLSERFGSTSVYINTDLDDQYIAKYEDRPVIENIRQIFFEAGIKLLNSPSEVDSICVVFSKNSGQKDYAFEQNEISNDEYHPPVDKDFKNKSICVLDLLNANGGNIQNIISFLEKNDISIKNIIGYNAWNTASNSVGTAAFDCVVANLFNPSEEYLAMRILDDYIYQGKVRSEVNLFVDKQQENIWDIEHNLCSINKQLNQLMMNEIDRYQNWFDFDLDKFRFTLPWNRTFEIKII